MAGTGLLTTEGRRMGEQWLKCSITKGMFTDERAVTCFPKQGNQVSFFVPLDKVWGDIGADGFVRVRVFYQNDSPWAVLPTEDQTIIPVKEADLKEADLTAEGHERVAT